MRYGLELPTGGVFADVRFLAELAALAERAGWDGVFVEDYVVHHIESDAPTVDPWIALAAMAVATQRIRIGPMVTPLPRRRPWIVARETVTLDQLSEGRLTLGVGLGDTADAGIAAMGEETATMARAGMLDEALEVLVGLWHGEPFTHHGAHFHVEGVTFLPAPVQVPRIPIWVGGNWPHRGVMRRAARWDGFVGGKEHGDAEPWCLTPQELVLIRAEIERWRTVDTPFDFALGGAVRGAITGDLDRDREWIEQLREAGATWWMEYVWKGDRSAIRDAVSAGPLLAG